MKQFSQKIASVLMAFVVVFSTMSFTISEHYCGGDLVSTTVFFEVDSCEMEMKTPSTSEDCNFKQEDCCNDVVKIVEGQSELRMDISNLSFNHQVFVASFVYSYVNLFEGLDKNIVPFKNYSPPLLVTNIQVLDQVFLI